MKKEDAILSLRAAALRATPRRAALLRALEKAGKPMTAEELHGKAQGLDLVTVYRNLQDFAAKGLVREVRFKDAAVRYELAHGGHHHHVVCTNCGTIDELPACNVRDLEKEALKKSGFAAINEHALEFFGLCKECA